MKILWIDTETTGLQITSARICQLGMIWDNGNTLDEKSILLNPTIPIPQICTNVHGISDDMVKDKETFKDISEKLKSLIERADVIGTYNGARYDWPILKYEMLRSGYDIEDKNMIDVYRVWVKLEGKRKGQRLIDCYSKFCGGEFNAHNASDDIRATRDSLYSMMKHYNFSLEDVVNI